MNELFAKQYPGSLFWGGALLELLQERSQAIATEVNGYSLDALSAGDIENMATDLEGSYSIEPLRLHRDKIEIVQHGNTAIDDQKRTCLVVYDPSLSRQSAATFYLFAVPFDGDGRLFMRRPTEIEENLPWGEVVGSELHILCKTTSADAVKIRSIVDDNINLIERWMKRVNSEVIASNSHLKSSAINRLQARKNKLIQEQTLAQALGFPIRARSAAPNTFEVPVHRKKLPVITTNPPDRTIPPNPHLDEAAYESILQTIGSMARVLELSPKAFASMGEEALRFLLLVPLNIHYEGQATGETFNWEGKTDIIIKVGGRNIFIAECKFWGGAKIFGETIDQLLGYTAWRDTKTAIILFNRNKGLSAVLRQIPDLVKSHSNFKREITSYKNETGFRFVLHHRDDKDRELTLTVLVFDVPS